MGWLKEGLLSKFTFRSMVVTKVRESHLRGWVAQSYGQEVTRIMERAEWKKDLGPGATLLLVLCKQGAVEEGSKCREGRVGGREDQGISLYRSMMYEIKLNIGDLTGKTLVAVVPGKDKVIL